MKLVFLPEVDDDIDRLYNFLKDKSPRSAQKAMLAIDEGIEMLLSNPYMAQQARTCICGRLEEHIVNNWGIDRSLSGSETGVELGWGKYVGSIVYRDLESELRRQFVG